MELQVLLEWRTELEAKTRRLQLEEQFERIERSGQLQQPWQSGNLQQPWLQDRLGPQPGLWPGQGVPAACPVQGVPAGWTGAQLGRAQAVQIYPGQMHAARLQCEAPPQMAWQAPPGGGLEQAGGGCGHGRVQQSRGAEPDHEGPPGDWQPGASAQMGQSRQLPRGGREQPRPETPSVRPVPRGTVGGLSYPAPELPHLAWVPSEENDPDSERWQKCLLCDKWVNDEHSHSGTRQASEGSKGHQKNLRNYPPGSPWYERNVVQERRKWHPEQSREPISV